MQCTRHDLRTILTLACCGCTTVIPPVLSILHFMASNKNLAQCLTLHNATDFSASTTSSPLNAEPGGPPQHDTCTTAQQSLCGTACDSAQQAERWMAFSAIIASLSLVFTLWATYSPPRNTGITHKPCEPKANTQGLLNNLNELSNADHAVIIGT